MKDTIDSSIVGVDGSIGARLDIAALIATFHICIIVVLINVIYIILIVSIDNSLRSTHFSLSLVTAPLRLFVPL